MACDPSCLQGGMGCGGGMMGPMMGCCGTGGAMGYPGATSPGPWGGQPAVGYQQQPMAYQQSPMGYQQSPLGYLDTLGCQSMGCQSGPFEPGSGCGGSYMACAPQGADIPKQARPRKRPPPSSTVPKRKVGSSYTTLVTPLAGAKELTEEETKGIPPDHERFDTLTLAFGTKPGTDKPPKILLTLKSPKVIDAKLSTGNVGTQVHYRDLGLPDPNVKPDDTKSRTSKSSKKSKRSKQSTKGSKRGSKKSQKSSKKGAKGKKGKK